jgi:hypothetical protein
VTPPSVAVRVECGTPGRRDAWTEELKARVPLNYSVFDFRVERSVRLYPDFAKFRLKADTTYI